MSDKFKTTFGPGTVIGAFAQGSGAKAEGTVTIGARPKVPPDRIRAKIDISKASPSKAAKWLRAMADAVENEHTETFAKGSPGESSVAWTWEADDER